ncbi:MAG: hypothetical protein JWQ12_1254 [Glaciihabitans sp.]|nr:hypothetical protein [Glaciihabitans sp.]
MMYWVALLVPLLTVVAAMVFAAARRQPLVTLAGDADVAASATAASQRSALRLRLALLLTPTIVGVLAAAVIATFGQADAVGGPLGRTTFLLITPAVAASVAAVLLGYVPTFGESPSARVAELARRNIGSFAGRGPLIRFAVLEALLVVAVLAFGFLAAPHSTSLFYFYEGGMAGGGGTFPGFGYGIPVLIGVLVTGSVSALALAKIAGAPRPTNLELRAADDALRRLTSATVLAIASFAVAVSLAVILLMAGFSFWDVAAVRLDFSGHPVPVNATAQFLAALSHAGVGAGVGFVVLAIYFLVRAVSSATRRPFKVDGSGSAS